MPSSKYLARDAVRLVIEHLKKPGRKPVSILEVGPGTGTFTERILPELGKDDRFDVVELNDYFYKILRRRFESNDSVSIHHKDFLAFQSEQKYDFILSSLPYERIAAPVTRMLWKHKLSLCNPGTFIIYYKYVNFNRFRSRFEKNLVRSYLHDEKVVFRNVPPARLLTLKVERNYSNGLATASENGSVRKAVVG